MGVFPCLKSSKNLHTRLPHARGGVSRLARDSGDGVGSSPRPWGCFQVWRLPLRRWTVFPTPVGVFPLINRLGSFKPGLPHARGGVSLYLLQKEQYHTSSPRPWGCFCQLFFSFFCLFVFPTPVGVFLHSLPLIRIIPGLPHARGGVSDTTDAPDSRKGSSPRPWGCFLKAGEVSLL